jgi:hypothetical protein
MYKYNNKKIMQNIQRRRNSCSFCRRAGHNRLTCDDTRLLDFEIICASQCQTMTETEFYTWLSETNDSDLLKTYAAKKTRIPFNNIRDISIYKDAITRYIYETYKYPYNIPEEESAVNFENNMNASLINDIHSAYLFLEMTENMYARRIDEPKKFAIESILKPISKTKQKEIGECCICFDSYKKPEFVILNCNHEFCNGCLKQALISDNRPKPCCAYCRTEVISMTSRTTEIYDKMCELVI